MRPVIEHLKQMITRKEITEFNWVDTKSCHADILTKKGVAAEKILDIFQSGKTMWWEYYSYHYSFIVIIIVLVQTEKTENREKRETEKKKTEKEFYTNMLHFIL